MIKWRIKTYYRHSHMDELSRSPVYGAVWRELRCCLYLGVKWHLIWALGLLVLPRYLANICKIFVILGLVWRSVTKHEMISGGPYTLPNIVQRFSVSTLLLLLVSNLLGFVPDRDGITYLPLSGLPLESELNTFFLHLLLFLLLRSFWNLATLVSEGWFATRNLDPIPVIEYVGDSMLQAKNKLTCAIQEVVASNAAHLNWTIFSAMDAICREVDCLLVMGFSCTMIFVFGLVVFQLQFRLLVIFYCLGVLKAFKHFHIGSVTCTTGLRLGVRLSINLSLLAILLLQMPNAAMKNPGMTGLTTFMMMRLVHLCKVVWELHLEFNGLYSQTWCSQTQSKLMLVPLALRYILLRVFRTIRSILLGTKSIHDKIPAELQRQHGSDKPENHQHFVDDRHT